MRDKLKKITTYTRAAILSAIFIFGVSQVGYAVMAYPGPIPVTQPDGSTLEIRVHGDEFFNYTTTNDGYIIARANDGYFYYADYNSGELRISKNRAGTGFSMARTKSIPSGVVLKIRERNIERVTGIQRAPISLAPGGGLDATRSSLAQRGVVILVEYPNKPFSITNPVGSFSNMMNQSGYSANGATGSIADYYDINSTGAYRPQFDIYGPYTMSKNVGAYYDEAMWLEHAVEAMILGDNDINYSQYASDGSIVDMVLIYYAGYNAAEGGFGIWPHKHSVYDRTLTLDGVRLYDYACTSELKWATGVEMAGIGTMAHEFGHVLGLSDIYVTDDSHKATESWRKLDVMNGGSYNNEGRTPPLLSAYARYQLGWLELEDIDHAGEYVLEPLMSNKAYRMKTDIDGEFFVLENRGTGANNIWDSHIGIGSKGMLLYHMDYTTNVLSHNGTPRTAQYMWTKNNPNGVIAHQCADVIESSNSELHNQALSSVLFPGSLNRSQIGFHTTPAIYAWSGANLGFEITNLSVSGDNILFKAESSKEFAPFSAMIIPRTGYVVGAKLNTILHNTANVESCTFKVNGSAVSGNYAFSSAGVFTVVAEVKYTAASGLGEETITRKIKVTR